MGRNSYPPGIKGGDGEMAEINIERHAFHGEWNDAIRPLPTPS